MKLLEYIENNILVFDGGMGTLLQKEGLKPGELPETWNMTRPDVLVKIHGDYFSSGANVATTNTFGANSLKFSPEELDDIVRCAVGNVRAAIAASDAPQAKFAALDIGPTGRMLKPLGDFDFEDAVAVFAETVKLGVKYGADFILIETMNDSYETKAALLAAKENSTLPVFVTNAYGEDGKLMTGANPAAMTALLEGMGADVIGVNCSLGPKQLTPIADEYLRNASVPVMVQPNAGLPHVSADSGETVYDVTPEEFADACAAMVSSGVRVIGGCCGTTPDYIRAVSERIRKIAPVPVTEKHRTVVSSYTHAVQFGENPILIGERINPTGKKRFKQALAEHDIGYILNEGISQAEKGVHILDVNVGLPEIDECAMLTEAVTELQAVTDLPLQIDTADPAAMESALRRYNGKAMINSVNGKAESMAAIFPLMKKYGGVAVALTLDEDGIPENVEGRVAIAEKILREAEKYGISKDDIIFDTLAMTISASAESALTTVKALHEIRHRLGCHTSLGVSNISFGLPQRDFINSTFFAMALEQGLSAAILNPYSGDMMKTYYAYRALHALDENCAEYIDFASNFVPAQSNPVNAPKTETKPDASADQTASELQKAIEKGLREQAAALTGALLASVPPLDVVQQEIIPALDTVGRGFEAKTVYLPQLLMSAEAAKAAFEKIREKLAGTSSSAIRSPFVIATVKGDIHDIGKNIVKLILENYGFAVSDLGRDVAPETIAEEVIRLHAPFAGLSALMTTTVPAMEETVKLLREKAPWCRIVVGGAVLTEETAANMGADKYAKDAMETVRWAEEEEKRLM
ncbi:MAG: homocysteine S-methyltransferase family protein [Clostridia bacterium]|nr:homocysteine S-methyltransferase family protein [Clostridia bacterium]